MHRVSVRLYEMGDIWHNNDENEEETFYLVFSFCLCIQYFQMFPTSIDQRLGKNVKVCRRFHQIFLSRNNTHNISSTLNWDSYIFYLFQRFYCGYFFVGLLCKSIRQSSLFVDNQPVYIFVCLGPSANRSLTLPLIDR